MAQRKRPPGQKSAGGASRAGKSKGSRRDKTESTPAQRKESHAGQDSGDGFFRGGHLSRTLKTFATVAGNISARDIAKSTGALTSELSGIMAGKSDRQPARQDVRFKDPAWQTNPLYRRLSQGYLAWSDTIRGLVDKEERSDDWRNREHVRFLTEILLSSASPSNYLLTNPAVVDKAVKSGGASLLKGARHFIGDLAEGRTLPRHALPEQFEVGRDLAATPGAVVFRNEVLELIQYQPVTSEVLAEPTLILPPQISRYYFMDMAPGRSFVEYALGRGVPVFIVSWRNPGPAQRDWDFDTYISACFEALDAICSIFRSKTLNLVGVCAGGITATLLLNIMAARGDKRVRHAAYVVTLLDFDVPCPLGAFHEKSIMNLTHKRSESKGILPGRSLGNTFNWMRPNDLVWRYWVNNYLLGNEPPPFDILYWNDDSTNLPYALHKQFLSLYEHNLLCKPGEFQVMGYPVDLSTIELETFVVGADADHLTPWRGCYRTCQLIPGKSTFVLSNAGHIAGLINPPNNPKARYLIGPVENEEAGEWAQSARQEQGTWWQPWGDWVIQTVGKTRRAPKKLGNTRYPVLDPAPGSYVRT
jgi:polyhydroxyalkanoate synthase